MFDTGFSQIRDGSLVSFHWCVLLITTQFLTETSRLPKGSMLTS
jgi:hypothetical protein